MSADIQNTSHTKDELFGLWKDRSETANVGQYIRNCRQGRKL
jgi:hypothetical protein